MAGDQGVTGVVPCGTTGESPTLSWQEHDDLVGAAIECCADSVGVLAGTGSNNTQEAIRGTEDAAQRGASAALLVAASSAASRSRS
ncbi:MAG TPA: dihydrodipicolinate synthase family protein [Sandaracinaceae bacterium LLY-WYZ-13_1]|nr:dihydrodipicolinate synthase family protein [Sandaracinaceae bacterium LLY-WYZ-13_1]